MFIGRWKWTLILITTIIFLALATSLSARFAPTEGNLRSTNDNTDQAAPTGSTQSPIFGGSHACPSAPPKSMVTPNTQGRFNWRSISVHYPIGSYARLPLTSVPAAPTVQHIFSTATNEVKSRSVSRQQAVKEALTRCWKSYKDQAWTKDELAPITGGSRDTFGSWGATLVDSLDTLWIMGLKQEFSEAVDAAIKIDFAPTGDGDINMFETIIRYLGGFLGAYDVSGCHDERLLNKAIEVAGMAYASFDTPNRMPASKWNPRKAANGEVQLPGQAMVLAEAASASLEFTRLSQLTGDMRYFDAISRVTNVLEEQQGLTKLPGMWPVTVDMLTLNLTVDRSFGLGAMADSAYEYLPKMYQLLKGAGPESVQYRDMYEYSMATAIEHTLFRPMVKDKADILMAGTHVHGKRDDQGQHLVCFAGGMLALGGRLFGNKTHVDIGRRLSDGCAWAYKNAPNGIMPEVFSMIACPSWSECGYSATSNQGSFGWVDDGRYQLRPEAIESIFYMYRITGETKYQEIAWEMFQAIEKHTRTEFANAAIKDVTKSPPEKEDSMESFWLAETLKYFFLIFSDPDTVSLDEFVFNTEAHPFRIPGR